MFQSPAVVPVPGHRVVIEPPSTLEPLVSNTGLPGIPLVSGAGFGPPSIALGSGGFGTGFDQESVTTAAAEESLPDDVPLTRTQLQAKVWCTAAEEFTGPRPHGWGKARLFCTSSMNFPVICG